MTKKGHDPAKPANKNNGGNGGGNDQPPTQPPLDADESKNTDLEGHGGAGEINTEQDLDNDNERT